MDDDKIPLISVVVPIYNVEKYIRRCLESIKKQVFEDFEVIMINDGTKDNSAEIAQEFADSDSRFKLFHQQNSGVGAVRNRGISLARGEYIAFVDGDDAIFRDHLSLLSEAANKNNADIVCCSYCVCDENGENIRRSRIRKKAGVYEISKIIRTAIRDCTVRSYLWSKLWRRSLFVENNVRFPNAYFEDSAIVPILFGYAKTVAVIEDSTYIYTCRNSSITGCTSPRCVPDYIAANKLVNEFYESRENSEFYKGALFVLRQKVAWTTFGWVFVRIFRAKSFEYSARNMGYVLRFMFGGKKRRYEEFEESAT